MLGRLPPLSQGQLGLEQSGKDSEQLSLEPDRELKMELRDDACRHWESRGRNMQGVQLLLGAQVSSTGFSSLRSGKNERVVQGDSVKGQRVRNKALLRTLLNHLTKKSKFQEGRNRHS